MFKGHMDESGITGEPVCVVGGFVGSEEACDDAARKWQAALDKFKVPVFHSYNFWERTNGGTKGIYAHLGKQDTSDFLLQLMDSVQFLTPVALAVGVEQYLALTDDERRWLTTNANYSKNWPAEGMPSAPYFFCFQHSVIRPLKLVPEGEQIFYTFDIQDHYEDKARELYNQMLKLPLDNSNRLGGTLMFSLKQDAVLLQAADLMVFITRWFAEGSLEEMCDELAQQFVRRFVLKRDYVIAGMPEFMDKMLQSCPVRSSFWQGLTEPDLIENLRRQKLKVLAVKNADGAYRSSYIPRGLANIVGRVDLRLDKK